MLRVLLIIALASLTLSGMAPSQTAKKPGHYVFVWAGDQAKQGNDFLLVVDADPASPRYGELVTSVATDQKSMKAHHTEYEMPASGMLFANDHDANRTMIFDLRNPLKPRVAASFESLGGFSMPHSFVRLPNGNVLAAFQYPDHGGHMSMGGKSGGLVEIDDTGTVVRSVSNADPAFADEGLLPYSLAILPKIDRVIVTNSPMGDDYLLTSNTYQLLRLSDLKLLGTYRLDPGEKLNGHVSPEEPRIGPTGRHTSRLCRAASSELREWTARRPLRSWCTSFPEAGAACRPSSAITWCRACLPFTATSFSTSPMAPDRSKYRSLLSTTNMRRTGQDGMRNRGA